MKKYIANTTPAQVRHISRLRHFYLYFLIITSSYLSFSFMSFSHAHEPPQETTRQIEADLKKHPNNTQLIIERALSRLRSGDPLGCINDLDGINELDAPRQMWKVRGLCNEMLGEFQQSEMDFFRYIKHYPKDSIALAALGRVYNKQSRWSEARVFFLKAARSGHDPELYRLASVAARKVGRKGYANQILAEGYLDTGAASLAILLRSKGVRPPAFSRKQINQSSKDDWSAGNASLLRKPYIQMVNQHSVTIVWRTKAPSHGLVRYGLSPTDLRSKSESQHIANQHEISIKNLKPGTRYYYRVDSKNQVLSNGEANYFETAPLSDSDKTVRLWVVGDSGTGGKRQKQVRDSMLRYTELHPPDLFLHVGDMAYGKGKVKEFTNHFFKIYEDILLHTPIWPAMGNHEGITSNAILQKGPYYDSYVLPSAGESGGLPSGTEAYYSFDYANIHFVVLDSYQHSRKPNGAMLTWLKSDLEETDKEWIIAYWHHPPYTKGSHDSDIEFHHIQMREYAIPILEKAGVDLVLGGHSHIYERSYLLNGAYNTPSTKFGIIDPKRAILNEDGPYTKRQHQPNDGAIYVVAGHGGTGVSGPGNHPLMAFTEKKNGSVLVDINDNKMTITNLRYDGKVTDKTGIMKGEGIFITQPTGDERLTPGQSITIKWASDGNISNVDLEWSCDGGNNWFFIAKSAINNGQFNWHVPYVESDSFYIRATSVSPPHYFDKSAIRSTIKTEDFELSECISNEKNSGLIAQSSDASLWDTNEPIYDEGNRGSSMGCNSSSSNSSSPYVLFALLFVFYRRQIQSSDTLFLTNK